MAVWRMRDAIPIHYLTQNLPSEDVTCIHIHSSKEMGRDCALWRDWLMSEAAKPEQITPLGANTSYSSACHS